MSVLLHSIRKIKCKYTVGTPFKSHKSRLLGSILLLTFDAYLFQNIHFQAWFPTVFHSGKYIWYASANCFVWQFLNSNQIQTMLNAYIVQFVISIFLVVDELTRDTNDIKRYNIHLGHIDMYIYLYIYIPHACTVDRLQK